MNHIEEFADDIALARYIEALEAGDLDALQDIWEQAETDPGLEALLTRMNREVCLDSCVEAAGPASGTAVVLPYLQKDLAPQPLDRPERLVEASYTGYRCTVLLVDDEPHMLDLLRRALEPEFEVLEAASVASAQKIFSTQAVDILLTDLCLKGPRQDQSGVELLEWVRGESPRTVSLLMSGFGETESVIEAINRGHVFFYLGKPFRSIELLRETLRRAGHAFTLERKNQELLERLKDLNMELDEKVRRRTGELIQTIQELQQSNAMLEKLALTDVLTGLPNRRAMDHLAERDLLWRKRSPAPLALGLVDIDLFKAVNTKYRWGGGDRVLTEVARCLKGSLREIDQIGRYGGEEFMLLAPQADRHGAEVLAERLRRKVEAMPVAYRGDTIRVTVSVGMAVAEKDTPTDLLRMKDAAEAALQTAKAQGRNCCVINALPPDAAVRALRTGG